MVTKSKNSCKLGNKVPNQPARDKIKEIEMDFRGDTMVCTYNQDRELVTICGVQVDNPIFSYDFTVELETLMQFKLTELDEDYSAEMRSDESRGN